MLSRSRLPLKMNNIRYSHKWSSKSVRKQFLDYFIDSNDHKFVRSSPVVPFCDPTVAFVNAGMNQFKGIFLNKQNPTYPRVANSQKCVRVGGKHNDLAVVGTDGYHHTFFEMLGNWSFGDYFKYEACTLAWNLLTGPYQINPSALYITYFGGDKKLNLEPDLECKEIWRSLGVPVDRIIPFGVRDNFWEMGSSGPCGPCTEIHIDHTYSNAVRSNDVNRDLPDLTELWNIVFIQYNRNMDGSIDLLPKRHIDTGMGFERLTAILQNKKSNYDTDIFTSLFKIIEKNCKGIPRYSGSFENELDTAYRILADHSRTVTVCLADGMIPEQNQKLRRILRKALYLSETTFKIENLLKDLTLQVSDNLGETYPEIITNIKQIHDIIDFEKEVYNSLRTSASKNWANIINTNTKLEHLDVIEMPGLVSAYKELETLQPKEITSELAFRLFDTYGLDEETITKLSQVLNLPFDTQQLQNELENARKKTQNKSANNSLCTISELLKISNTINNNIYDYNKIGQSYSFQDLDITIVKIISENKFTTETILNKECFLILNKSNFYTESGGQVSDKGIIKCNNKIFKVMDVLNINGHILHRGILESDSLKLGEKGTLILDKNRRIKIMANHTAVHLLNAAIKNIVNVATCQKSSAVYPEYLSFEVGIYGNKLTMEDIENIENLINNVIRRNINVEIKVVDSQGLLSLDNVTLIPGEIYPEDKIRIININDAALNFSSCEPCCGTHVLNTGDIIDFCITNYKSLGRSTGALTAVTRDKATLAHQNGKELSEKINNLLQMKHNTATEVKLIEDYISDIKNIIYNKNSTDYLLPIYVKTNCLNILKDVTRKIRGTERGIFKDLVSLEMKKVLSSNCSRSKNNNSFIVHFLECSSKLENIQLQYATKICPEVPVIVLSYSESLVKARCCVPKNFVNESFNAQIWLSQTVGNIFKSSCSAPRGQESALISNMKQRKVNLEDWEKLLSQALKSAETYAYENL